MNPVELLNQMKGRVPSALYEELEYQIGRYERDRDVKPVVDALFRDALVFLREEANSPMVRKEQNKTGIVYRINDLSDDQYESFGLLSEPTEEGFSSSYHDVINDRGGVEIYRPENPLEQKGRACKPLFLDAYPDFVLEDGYRTLGVDVASMGDDKTVIIARVGIHCTDVQSFYKQDTNETTGRVMDAISEHRPNEVVIDTTGGWGDAVYHNLVSLDIEELCILTPIHFNQRPRFERFNTPNARAEMYFLLAERFREGRITLPRHKELIEQLAWIKYRPNPATGQFIIQPKEICKKDNKVSPDAADALALAFYTHPGLEVY